MTVKRFKPRKIVCLLGLACLLTSGAGLASDDDHENAKRLREAGEIVSLEQILDDARRRHGGRIIEIDLEREDGRYVYEVEFVDGRGQVYEYYYDAGDGRFLRESAGESED